VTHETRPLSICPRCSGATEPSTPDTDLAVAGILFTGPVAGRSCTACGYKVPPDRRGFRLRVARDLAMNGCPKESRGAVFEFFREVLGYERKVLGEMLDEPSDVLLAWEMGSTPVPQVVMAVMGRLILDNLDPQHAEMVRLLRAVRFPDPKLKSGAIAKV
jgi:hypothetical protein